MLIALIAPTNMLDFVTRGDIHFCLAQRVLEDEQYASFYKQRLEWKILDNGAYEKGKSLKWDDVLRAAEIIDANEVVLPDIPQDPVKSYKLTKETLSTVGLERHWMAVPHGRSFQEYRKYFKLCSALDKVRTIGFSILDLWKYNWRIRPFVVQNLAYEPEWNYTEKHLLGLDCILELKAYLPNQIRSVDTSLPFTYAWHRKKLTLTWDEPKLERVPDYVPRTRIVSLYSGYNINVLKRVAHGYV